RGRSGLFSANQDFSYHAYRRAARGSIRKTSVGGAELIQSIRRIEKALPRGHVRVFCFEIYAGLVHRRDGKGARDSWRRSVGVWIGGEPAYSRDARPIRARAGID